ncbi:hypothetical protein [Methylobacterium sp. ID0610]|uniref:hypothetical protein n=1 Tax=Methylobacterium carpenticola TaxID=3344827 RepID=UPI00369BDC35
MSASGDVEAAQSAEAMVKPELLKLLPAVLMSGASAAQLVTTGRRQWSGPPMSAPLAIWSSSL